MKIEYGEYYVLKRPFEYMPSIVKVFPCCQNELYSPTRYFVSVDPWLPKDELIDRGWQINPDGRIPMLINAWISHKASSLEKELW